MAARQSEAVTRALRLVAKGATGYAAAKQTGIALSTIYRALKRRSTFGRLGVMVAIKQGRRPTFILPGLTSLIYRSSRSDSFLTLQLSGNFPTAEQMLRKAEHDREPCSVSIMYADGRRSVVHGKITKVTPTAAILQIVGRIRHYQARKTS